MAARPAIAPPTRKANAGALAYPAAAGPAGAGPSVGPVPEVPDAWPATVGLELAMLPPVLPPVLLPVLPPVLLPVLPPALLPLVLFEAPLGDGRGLESSGAMS